MGTACYVGIDVAKDRLDVHLRPLAKTIAVGSDEKGIAQLKHDQPGLGTTGLVTGGQRRNHTRTCAAVTEQRCTAPIAGCSSQKTLP